MYYVWCVCVGVFRGSQRREGKKKIKIGYLKKKKKKKKRKKKKWVWLKAATLCCRNEWAWQKRAERKWTQ